MLVQVIFKATTTPHGCDEAVLHLIWRADSIAEAVSEASMFIAFLNGNTHLGPSQSWEYLDANWYEK